MGQLIEIREFLHAFSKKLQLSSDVPSIEQLMLAARLRGLRVPPVA